MFDPVDRPSHYSEGRRFETIEVIEDWELSYRLGNAVKYISRAGRKDPSKTAEDLKKARWYLDREIETLEAERTPYAVTYEDVLEDYAACAAEGYEYRVSLDDVADRLDAQYDLWDPSLGPVEPPAPAPDYLGQAEWDSSPVEPPSPVSGASCPFDPDELHKDLDQFEQDEVVATFERRGLIFGVDKNGRTYILGTNAETV